MYLALFFSFDVTTVVGGRRGLDAMTLQLHRPLYGEDVSITLLPWKASINTHTHTLRCTHTLKHDNTFTSQ